MKIMHRDDSTLLNHKGILYKLALVVLLVIGGGNFAWADSNTTINDGTSKNSSYFPFYGMYINKSTASSQVIIPSGSLTSIKGCTISKIVFYTNQASTTWGTATFKVYLNETDDTAFGSDALADFGTMTEVYSGSVSTNASKEMEITFANGFAYSGKNLLVGFDLTNPAASGTSITCYGIAPTPSSTKNMAYKYIGYSGTAATYRESFLPKMTIYYSGAAAPTSLTVNSCTYNSATLGWTNGGDETQWQLVCSTTDNSSAETPTLINSNPYTIEGLSENTTYYAFVRSYYSSDTQSDWTSVSFTTPRQYPIPTGFSLTGFTATTASFTWSNGEGTEPTAWQIKYSTDEDFNPDESGSAEAVSSKPHTLEGLTEGTTYYAYIRARYGESNYSRWSNKVSFIPSNIISTLVNDGTDKSYNLPIQGSSVSSIASSMVKSQYVIPSTSLEDVNGRQITKLTFYADNSNISWGTATFEVYLNEVSYTTFSSTNFGSWGTKVFDNASLSVSGNEMVVEFNTPYNYNGGNLQIGFKQTGVGSSSSSTWLSVKDGGYANLAIYGTGTGSTGTRTYYAPKVTITSVPITADPVQMGENGYTTYASPRALDLTNANLPSGLKAYKASIIDGSWVRFTEIDDEVVANTGILLEGTANTTYNIPLADSGNDISSSNLLLVNTSGGTFTGESGYTYYAIKKNSDPLIFATFSPSSVAIPTNKAYLKVSDVQAHSLSCMFDDENSTTGVETMFNEQSETNSKIYNLQGQRVTAPQKGLYVVNGKKFVNK